MGPVRRYRAIEHQGDGVLQPRPRFLDANRFTAFTPLGATAFDAWQHKAQTCKREISHEPLGRALAWLPCRLGEEGIHQKRGCRCEPAATKSLQKTQGCHADRPGLLSQRRGALRVPELLCGTVGDAAPSELIEGEPTKGERCWGWHVSAELPGVGRPARCIGELNRWSALDCACTGRDLRWTSAMKYENAPRQRVRHDTFNSG